MDESVGLYGKIYDAKRCICRAMGDFDMLELKRANMLLSDALDELDEMEADNG
jgi:hypothetical protein